MQSDFEVTCFAYEGINTIKAALMKYACIYLYICINIYKIHAYVYIFVQVRSDFEVTCFAYEGIDAIKAALMKGIEHGTEINPIAVRLIAPPLYVMTCNTLDQVRPSYPPPRTSSMLHFELYFEVLQHAECAWVSGVGMAHELCVFSKAPS